MEISCAPESIVTAPLVVLLLMETALIDHPAIVPLSAFNKPVKSTLNGASSNVGAPRKIPSSASAIKISLEFPNVKRLLVVFNIKSVPVKLSDPIVNPPILPPVNNTLEPVISPPAETLNPDDDINEPGSVLSCDDEILNTSPTDNEDEPIANPPIVPPASAVIVPCNTTSPSLAK